MTDKSAAYQAGVRDTKAMSMEEKIDAIYGKLFLDKDCFSVRVSSLELWMKILGVIFTLIISPLVVILIAKVFFNI